MMRILGVLVVVVLTAGCATGGGAPELGSGLDFRYKVSGSTRWKPLTVFNDGIKTIIEMPASMAQTEAPTLLLVRSGGGLFAREELVLVNYRVQRNRYIVDSIFDKAVLLAGVGGSQDRVTIARSR